MAETIGRATIIILADGDAFSADVMRVIREHDPELQEAGATAGKSFSTGMRKENDKGLDEMLARFRRRIDRSSTVFERMGDRVGRFFGRGARNDLLNFFGSFVRLPLVAAASVAKLVGRLGALGKFLGEVRSAGLDMGASLAAAFGKNIIAAVVAVGVAFQLMGASLGILSSALVVTTGLVLALAGSLGFALVGAITAVAGALVPFAAALGVAALAMSGMDKKAQAFKDLKKDWKDLRTETARELFGKNMQNLGAVSSLLRGLRPVILPVADALGGLLKSLGRTAETKSFRDMMTQIGDALKPMVTSLGKIGGNLLLALGRAFIAAEPIIRDFLGWLEEVTDKLADSGKGGKDSPMAKFLNDAWASAKKVGRFVKEAIGLVLDLFALGKGTGDNIFTKMADTVEKIRDWLADPANQDTIQKWFQDAEKLADKIGEIVVHAKELVDALDTPENRTLLFKLLDIVDALIVGMTKLAGKIGEVTAALTGAGTGAVDSFKTRMQEAADGRPWDVLKGRIQEALSGVPFDRLKQRASEAWIGIKGFFSDAGTFFSGVGSSIASGFQSAWDRVSTGAQNAWSRLVQRASEAKAKVVEIWNGIVAFFSGLWGRIQASASSAWAGLTRRPQEAANKIRDIFARLPGQITTALGNLGGRFATWFAGIPGRARTAATAAAAPFRGLANKIISGAGNLAGRFGSWVAGLPGRARSTASSISSAFSGLSGKIISRAGSLASRFGSWVSAIPGRARATANSIASAFSGLASKAMKNAGSLVSAMGSWAAGVAGRARGVANSIVSAFSGLAGRIVAAIGTIVPRIRMPNIPTPTVIAKVVVPKTAAGGIFDSPQLRIFGEAGPEAVVPLRRPLAQVDPAVRALSAFAQGLPQPGSAPTQTGGKTIEVGGITINTPTENPRAVASEVIARMAAAAYI